MATDTPRRGILLRTLFLLVPAISILVTRSPYFTPTMAASQTKPWADAPIELIVTPQFQTKETDIFTTGATHMALLHNAILRGFNSIYQQAPHVSAADAADFIGYSLTWHKFVASHHDDEEATLFPAVEDLLADKTVWAATHAEHEAFLDGLAAFAAYLGKLQNTTTTTTPEKNGFDGLELRKIMDTFRAPFAAHFHAEIGTIAALKNHPRAPKPDTPEAAAAAQTFKSWGKSTVTKAGTLDVVPFFLLHLDGTVEDGMWASWPPIPAPIKWGLVNVGGAWYSGWWKFASCKGGRPQELYALR